MFSQGLPHDALLIDFLQHVINIYFYVTTNMVFKNLVDKVLVCGSSIFQIKGYHFVAIKPLVYDKGCHFLIL